MKEVLMLVGIPGSGKSTWVKNHIDPDVLKKAAHISADSIRKEFYGDENIQGNGQRVFEAVFQRFETALNNPHVETIIIDNTSVAYKTRKDYYKIIKDSGVECKIKLVVFNNFEQAKKWNKERSRVVPDDVMDRMISRFQMPPTPEEKQIPNLEVIKGS